MKPIDNNRINEVINLEIDDITMLMSQYNANIQVAEFFQMSESLSNTGYKVITNVGIYLLKLYSSPRDEVECAMYRYLKSKVAVPELYYYDNTKQLLPVSFAIYEFIEGITLAEYIRQKQCFPTNIAYEIGRMCAVIHKHKYAGNGWLDSRLNVQEGQELPDFCSKLLYLINSKPASYLKPETVYELQDFIQREASIFHQIDSDSVLSHGDFTCWNVMIAREKVYFIDFEFSCADSRYRDIGHFFRRKDNSIESHVDMQVYQAFAKGYHSAADVKLPENWLQIARICDIVTMLSLFLNEHFPLEWVSEIEAAILSTIHNNEQLMED